MIGNTMASPRQGRKLGIGRTLVALVAIAGDDGRALRASLRPAQPRPNTLSSTASAGLRSPASIPSPISPTARRCRDAATSSFVMLARSGVSATRETGRRLRPILKSTARGLAATTPSSIAGGASVPGDPRIWLVTGGRLYLFNSPESKAEFHAGCWPLDCRCRQAMADRPAHALALSSSKSDARRR